MPADLTFRDRAVYLADADALVLADLHVGRDATSDVTFPLGERADLVERLGALLDRFDPAEVVFAGDALHSFDRVPAGVAGTLAALDRLVDESGARLVVTPGNHDAMLAAVWSGPTRRAHRLADGTVVLHGHEPPEPDDRGAPRYVVGHDHPKITIEGRDWPCFLHGEGVLNGSDVLVLPAFTRLAGGVSINGNVSRGTPLRSPLVADVDRFRPIVRDETAGETHAFPRLGEFRRLL
ncbi:metallophosphoesterase [Halomarina halobia]|uniref:Metallophosphoesterase n=1 Tax=Halomarina halobia TaxID=3033386 RepID=A0ABD6AD32_9EURY|nr:metallophosphoesterase [Halomarina sp. PSR21]